MSDPRSPLSIDITDPNVRKLLEPHEAREHGLQPGPRPMVHLAGDPDVGYRSEQRLDSAKIEVIVTYKDFMMTVDVYPATADGPLELQYVCPRCRKGGRITAAMKAIEFDPADVKIIRLPNGVPASTGGRLSVEPFECTHELPEAVKHVNKHQHGFTLCKLRIAIDNNVGKDA